MFKIDKYYYKIKKISSKKEVEDAKHEIENLQKEIDNFDVDFSNVSFYKYKNRTIGSYKKNIKAEIVLNYLKDKINRLCSVHFQDRTTIMQRFFDELPTLSKLQDFTIVRFDFEKFFYSISNEYVINNILCDYKFLREDIDYLKMFAEKNKYSCAGFSLSNTFAELLARKFDLEVKSLFFEYGINFYSRYVDDGIFVLDTYLEKNHALELLNEAVNKVFCPTTSCNKVELNMEKTHVISKRLFTTNPQQIFSFLGYSFTLSINAGKINITYGITDEKINKYKNKFKFLIDKINKEGNAKKLQLALKISCSRVVYCNKNKKTWISKGIVQNYCMLKEYCDKLEPNTKTFLNNVYIDIFTELGIKIPGYLNSMRYKLIDSIRRNKTLILNPKIGVSTTDLNVMYLTVFGSASSGDYDYSVRRILEDLRIGY